MVFGMYRLFYVWLVLVLCFGCQKQDNAAASSENNRGQRAGALDPPMVESNSASLAREEERPEKGKIGKPALCGLAKSNVIKLETGRSVPSQTVLLLKAKGADFLSRCNEFPIALVECLAGAQTRADLGRCKFENDTSVRPDPGLMDLCDAAYDHARNLIVAAGAPGPALARYDERRPEALIQCSRERRAVVECLMAARSLSELKACRDSVDGSLPTIPDAVKAVCSGIHQRLFAGAEVPKFFHDKWSSNHDGFVVECGRMSADVRNCMKTAQAFADFQACAAPNSRKKKKRDGR